MSEAYKVISAYGCVSYYKLGTKIRHREDGPALIFRDGSTHWYQNGLSHRDDGPAYESNYGTKLWYYYGKLIDCNSQEEFERIIKLRAFW